MRCDYILENLSDLFCGNLVRKKADPFVEDIVVTQSGTMELYLNKEVADKNGIAANIRYLHPRKSINEILKASNLYQSGLDLSMDTLTWRIYSHMPYLESRYKLFKSYVDAGGSDSEIRRYQLARNIGGVFDLYIGYRGDWLELWQMGKTVEKAWDGIHKLSLGEHEEWQADLWRKLTVESPYPIHFERPSQILRKNIHLMTENLPERISIFGISNLPADFIEFFALLKDYVNVDLYYLMPCVEYWGNATKRSALLDKFDNPLLASWATLGRDFFNLLLERFDDELGGDCLALEDDQEHSMERTVLSSLQNDILRNSPVDQSVLLGGVKEFDDSIVINSCYSRMREIEVLREHILQLLTKGMEISDIVVMAPNIEDYVPYVEAVFNRLRADNAQDKAAAKSLLEDDDTHIPFTTADCSPLQASSEVETLFKILELAESKQIAQDIFDVISSDPLLAKFNFSSDDLVTMREMILGANIAWGENREDREKLSGIPGDDINTWEFGFKRLLAGYAFDCESIVEDGTLPLSLNAGQGILLGKLINVCELIFNYNKRLREKHSPEKWHELLLAIINDFFHLSNKKNEKLEPLYTAVNSLLQNWRNADFEEELPLNVLIKALENELSQGELGKSAFFRGTLTFCRLLPMRNIPFKAICVIGLNEGEFPRIDKKIGFDLSQKENRPGDRSLRKDDRYIFLETIMACREKLYLSYIGQSNSDNETLPPSVLISELLDYLVATTGKKAEDFISKHPLHGFDKKYFTKDSELHSFSKINCAAAKALAEGMTAETPFCPSALPLDENELKFSFNDFVSFFISPAKFFLNYRLKINLFNKSIETFRACEPFELNSLENYKLKDDFLEHLLLGKTFDFEESKKASGNIPAGIWGDTVLEDAEIAADSIAQLLDEFGEKRLSASLEKFTFSIAEKTVELSGEFENLHNNCQVFHRPGSVKQKNKDKLKAWLWHQLALKAGIGIERTHLIGYQKKSKHSPAKTQHLVISSSSSYMDELIEIFIQGLSKPLPLFTESSYDLIKQKNYDENIDEAFRRASAKWEGNDYSFDFDLADEANLICFGERPPALDENYRDEFRFLAESIYLRVKEEVLEEK